MAERRRSPEMTKASGAFRNGNFTKVLKLLEPHVYEHRTDSLYYHYMGYASLYTGDFLNASTYLQRSLQLDPLDADLLYGLAVLHLKRNEPGDAVRLWLKILESNREDECAIKGLNFLKSVDSRDMQEKLTLRQCMELLPYSRNRKRTVMHWIFFFSVCTVLILFFLFIF